LAFSFTLLQGASRRGSADPTETYFVEAAKPRKMQFLLEGRKQEMLSKAVEYIIDHSAREGHPITYGELGSVVGVNPRALGPLLESVNVYCQARHFPLLGSLVVRQDTGLPSFKPGACRWYGTPEGARRYQQKCYAKWRRA
jgi:hypothetical protein